MALVVLALALAVATQVGYSADTIRLWEGNAPGAIGTEDKDIPTLTIYKPAEGTANGAAIVICPGGSYWGLAQHEGEGYANYLTKFGITCYVLKYRLASGGYHHPCMINDAARAVRTVRYHAKEWGIDPERVGIMGSSAGGHLASSLVTHWENEVPTALDPIDRLSSRPSVGIICYGVISMGEYTHAGSKKNLLGEDPSEGMLDYMSGEKMTDKNTPPCFIWHTWEDPVVPVENSLMFANALRKSGVPFDLHIYEKGPHGIGLAETKTEDGKTDVHPWGKDLIYWLKVRNFTK